MLLTILLTQLLLLNDEFKIGLITNSIVLLNVASSSQPIRLSLLALESFKISESKVKDTKDTLTIQQQESGGDVGTKVTVKTSVGFIPPSTFAFQTAKTPARQHP